MRIHVLQHESFEGPGNIAHWAKQRGDTIATTHFYQAGWLLPSPDDFDFLVVMGGPMSVNDEALLPWLTVEKRFIRDCIAAGKKIIGVCLGAQLAANVLGARVTKNPQKEIGWFALEKKSPHPVFDHIPASLPVFHWHGETFGLPDGAELLASSEACVNQVFIWNNQVLGLQCHIEVAPSEVEGFLKHCASKLGEKSDFIQSAETIRAQMDYAKPMQPLLEVMLDRFIA